MWVDPLGDFGRQQRKIAEESDTQLHPFADRYPVVMVLAAQALSGASLTHPTMLDLLVGAEMVPFGEDDPSPAVRATGYPYGLFFWTDDGGGFQYGYLSAVAVPRRDGGLIVYKNPNCTGHRLPEGIFDGPHDSVWDGDSRTYELVRGTMPRPLSLSEFALWLKASLH